MKFLFWQLITCLKTEKGTFLARHIRLMIDTISALAAM
ncbi:hypothetical protein L492_0507 [Bordetella bronchiseptica 7E71]|nr:hypothetical protein L492_0507 [Bordetella bronchiseptica 7E71]